MEVGRIWGEVSALAETIDTASPWESPDASDLDRQTLDQWLLAQSTNSIAIRFFRLVVPALFSAESPELSLLHFLFYVRSGTSLEVLISTTGGAQETRVVGGTHQISERIAAELGDAVVLNTVVTAVAQDDSGVIVSFDGGQISARHVAVAIPQTLAGRLRYSPPLPAARDAVTQQFPAGSVIKFNVGYETPFWREDGLSGFVMSLDDEFNVVLDNSPNDGSCGVLVGFLEGAHAHRGIHSRLLWRPIGGRRMDAVRRRHLRSGRAHPLGRRRNLRRVERLHGRCNPLRLPSRCCDTRILMRRDEVIR